MEDKGARLTPRMIPEGEIIGPILREHEMNVFIPGKNNELMSEQHLNLEKKTQRKLWNSR